MIKNCIVCNKEFEYFVGLKKCCSKECVKEKDKLYREKYTEEHKVNHKEISCIICGKIFKQKRKDILTCSFLCARKRRLELNKQKYDRTYKPIIQKEKQCIICNKSFHGRSILQKCCSKACSIENNKRYQQLDKYKKYNEEYKKSTARIEYLKEFRKKYQTTQDYKEYQKKYKSTEEYKLKQKEYNKSPNGRHHKLLHKLKRREAESNSIHNYTKKEWLDKLNKTNGICPGVNGVCLNSNPNVGIDKLTTDHFYPISKANEDFKRTGIKRVYTIDDIQFLCMRCNASKCAKILNKGDIK